MDTNGLLKGYNWHLQGINILENKNKLLQIALHVFNCSHITQEESSAKGITGTKSTTTFLSKVHSHQVYFLWISPNVYCLVCRVGFNCQLHSPTPAGCLTTLPAITAKKTLNIQSWKRAWKTLALCIYLLNMFSSRKIKSKWKWVANYGLEAGGSAGLRAKICGCRARCNICIRCGKGLLSLGQFFEARWCVFM